MRGVESRSGPDAPDADPARSGRSTIGGFDTATWLILLFCLVYLAFFLSIRDQYTFNSHTLFFHQTLQEIAHLESFPLHSERIGQWGYYGPLLLYVLSPLFLLSGNVYFLYQVHIIFLLLSGFLVFQIGKRFFSARIGVLSFLVWSLLVLLGFRNNTIIEPETQSFVHFFSALFYISILDAYDQKRAGTLFLGTCSLAVLLQTHVTAFPALLVYLIVLVLISRRHLKAVLLNAAILALLCFPCLAALATLLVRAPPFSAGPAGDLPTLGFCFENLFPFVENFYAASLQEVPFIPPGPLQVSLFIVFASGLIYALFRVFSKSGRAHSAHASLMILVIWFLSGLSFLGLFPENLLNKDLHYTYILYPACFLTAIFIDKSIHAFASFSAKPEMIRPLSRTLFSSCVVFLSALLFLSMHARRVGGTSDRFEATNLAHEIKAAEYILEDSNHTLYTDSHNLLRSQASPLDIPALELLYRYVCRRDDCRVSEDAFPYPFRYLVFDNDEPSLDGIDSVELKKLNGFSVMKLRPLPYRAEIYSPDMTRLHVVEPSLPDPADEKAGRESSLLPLLVGTSETKLEDYRMKTTFDVERDRDVTFIMNAHFLKCREVRINGEPVTGTGPMGGQAPLVQDDSIYWHHTILPFEAKKGTNTLTLVLRSTAPYTDLSIFSIMLIQGKSLHE